MYITKVKKVKWSRYRSGVAQRVGRGIALLFHDRGTRRRWVVSTPRPHFTPGKTWYPFYRRLGGHQCRFGRTENLVPTGIRSRTVQPVVSSYTDWATRPTYITKNKGIIYIETAPMSEIYLKFAAFREFALDSSLGECCNSTGRSFVFILGFYTAGCVLTTEQRIN